MILQQCSNGMMQLKCCIQAITETFKTEITMKQALILSLAAVAAAGSASAGDDAGSWYVSPMLQYNFLDNSPPLKDNFGYQGGVGFNLPHGWALEGDFNRGEFDIKGTDSTRTQSGYSVDALKKFFPTSLFQPYGLAGAGELSDRLGGPGFSPHTFHTWLAEAGVGVLTGIGSQTGSTRVQLRTEAKYRLEWANPDMFGVKDPSGVMLGVGVVMNFGAPNETPPVIKEVVREVPAPAPAPPPPPPPPPAPPVPPPPKGEIRLQGVTFATNSAQLNSESNTVLDTTAASLKPYPNLVLEVRGYADDRGSQEYNLKLTQRRAESVMQYLQSHGVSNQMTAKGYGKEDPIADNSTKDGRLENRRVTLRVTGGSGDTQ
jgi:OmpA-OmpF porin, OOP family